MKILGLLRHAKSDWEDLAKRDFDRGLNERGRRGASVIGKHIADHGIHWDRVLASPAIRVRETLAEALPDAVPEFDERLYLAEEGSLIEVLQQRGQDAATVLIAGHNPGLQNLLFTLVSPSNENPLFEEAAVKFPTATFAVFKLDIPDWSQLVKDSGKLVHFARPRDLDPGLGPEH